MDWIQAAFRALTLGGPGAVRVEPLAKGLKVSKGSFYWHFQDLPDLQRQMIAYWEHAATQSIIDSVEATGGPARERLALLLELALTDLDAPFGGPMAEAAIRVWSLRADFVAEAQARVDAARLAHLEKLLREDGCSAPRPWARVLYAAYTGAVAVPQKERPALAAGLMSIYRSALSAG